MKSLIKKKWKAEDMPDQTGKIFIVTGANSGLGLEASLRLAQKGATVIMACRNLEKGEDALSSIKSQVKNAKLDLMQLDLSSLDSVRTFANSFKKKYIELHGLLNNAGIMQPPKMQTVEGFELQIGVNHLGHFVLTSLLFEVLEKTEGSRIINQSSIAHMAGKMNFDDINSTNKYSRTGAYGQSKLANLLFTYEMSRKLGDNHKVKSVAVHPGYTATNLQHSGPAEGGKSFLSRLYKILNPIMGQSVEMGTLPLLYAATEMDVETADYIGPRWISRGHPRRVKSNKRSHSKEDAQRLWQLSEEMTGQKFDL